MGHRITLSMVTLVMAPKTVLISGAGISGPTLAYGLHKVDQRFVSAGISSACLRNSIPEFRAYRRHSEPAPIVTIRKCGVSCRDAASFATDGPAGPVLDQTSPAYPVICPFSSACTIAVQKHMHRNYHPATWRIHGLGNKEEGFGKH